MNKFSRSGCSCLVALGTVGVLASAIAPAAERIQELLCTTEYASSIRTPTMFQKIDANGDGKVSRDEVASYFGKIFDSLDTNHDGVLDGDEWLGARTSVPVINYSSGGYATQLATDRMMHIIDKNNRKVVTKDQFIDQHEKIFESMSRGRNEPLSSQQWLSSYFPK